MIHRFYRTTGSLSRRGLAKGFAAIGVLTVLSACGAFQSLHEKESIPDLLAENGRLLWRKALAGFVADLDISRDGSTILISTAPNYESEAGSREFSVVLLDSRGAILWRKKPDAPVKAQAIADDGSWFVISTYDDKLSAFSRAGTLLWKANGTCKPMILKKPSRVLCYHDDDPDSEVAFDVFDSEGKRILYFPLGGKSDVLGLKVSDDGGFFAMALTRGRILLLDRGLHTLWQRSVGGEVVDLAVSSGAAPVVATLFSRGSTSVAGRSSRAASPATGVAIFSLNGKKQAEFTAPLGGREIRVNPEGKFIWVENIARGKKYLDTFAIASGGGVGVEESWKISQPFYADFLVSPMLSGLSLIVQREPSALISYGIHGEPEWKLSLPSGVKGGIYLTAYAAGSGSLIMATDEGNIVLVDIPRNSAAR